MWQQFLPCSSSTAGKGFGQRDDSEEDDGTSHDSDDSMDESDEDALPESTSSSSEDEPIDQGVSFYNFFKRIFKKISYYFLMPNINALGKSRRMVFL